MKNLFARFRRSKIGAKLPKRFELNAVFSVFSKREWHIFIVLLVVLVISTLAILQNINQSFMTSVPMRGGEISEGIVGAPRFINPVLAFSDADRDLVALIYSGLMRKAGDGTLVPDLAEKYEMSSDGLSYVFTLKDNIVFHDDTPLTVDDIIFTINTAKDPILKSPRKTAWDGILAEKIDEQTIRFSLKQPYASFLENSTLGILPSHIWGNSPVELNDANTDPVGSGPYRVSSSVKQSSGVIDSIELERFDKFVLGKPYIKNINLNFYTNEEGAKTALEEGGVDQVSSINPANAEILKGKGYQVESSVLPRVFGLFFNQNQNQIFIDKSIIRAIDQAIDKEGIVQDVLSGYGVVIDDPIPPNMVEYQKLEGEVAKTSKTERLDAAREILTKNGWTVGASGFLEKTTTDSKKKKTTTILEFSISTGNAPELAKSAELIKQDLNAIGMKVDVKTFEVGNLNQSVIRPRNYDALLFGQIINHESDLYAFWHSSQRNDPGFNVAMYTNAKVDKILEDAFVTVDEQQRIKKYIEFENEIKKDMPAVFLYSPKFIYVVSKELQQLNMTHIISPRDRFLNVYSWYVKMDNVWKIFAQNK